MKRRFLAFVLSLAMTAGTLPTAFAEELRQNDEYQVPVNDEEQIIVLNDNEPVIDDEKPVIDDEPVIDGDEPVVDEPIFVIAESIKLSKNEINLKVGATYTLTATVTPEVTPEKISNSPKWSTEDGSIAGVSGNGTVATVTGVAEGTTKITVKVDNVSDSCTVIVSNDAEEEPHEHVYTSEVTRKATCTEAGEKTYTCTSGDDSYTETIAPAGHTTALVVSMEPTCTEDGYRGGTYCSVCNKELVKPEVIKAKGHSYTEKVTKAATCTEDGVKTFTCKYGDDEYTETIPAKGHNEVAVDATEPTCTETGLTAGTRCDACGIVMQGQETVSALGHDYAVRTTKLPTRFSTGENTYTCKRCGSSYKTEIPKRKIFHWHSYTVTVIKEATCAGSGTKLYTCTCGAMYTEDITHEPSYTSEVIKEATCAESGTRLYTCTCGATYTEEIEMLPHTEVDMPDIAPTYRKTGLERGRMCTVCGTVTREPRIVDKLIVPTVTGFKLRNSDGKRLVAQWRPKLKLYSGYQIQFSTDKKMSKRRSYLITKARERDKVVSAICGKKLEDGGTFYVRIRAYIIEDGVKVYSAWSDIKKIKF